MSASPNVASCPDWLIVNVRVTSPPLIVMVPLRGEVAVLAATLYVTVPSPLPELPLVIVIQEADRVADHATLPITVIVWPPELAAPWLRLEGLMAKLDAVR